MSPETDRIRYGLLAAMLLQGFSGFAGGAGLVADPSGEGLRIPLVWLEDTPFSDYQAPGLVLLFVLGLFPLAVAWGLWKRRPWAGYGSLLVGAALGVWILVEIWMIGYQPSPPLQAIYGLLSVLIVVLAIAHLRTPEEVA